MRVAVPSISFCQTQILRDELLNAYPDTRFNDTFRRLSQEELVEFLTDRDAAIPAENAILGIHGVSLLIEEEAPTAAILTDVFGFDKEGTEGSRHRYVSGAAIGGIVDLHAVGGFLKPRPGRGSVHHLAFRAANDADQAAMTAQLSGEHGREVTEQKDRKYFRSVYFREPGHVLFEIATDAPGFAVDEPVDALGASLMLPDQYEPLRERIEATLPEL